MQGFFKLSQLAAEQLAQEYGTPLIVLSEEQVAKNYNYLKEHLPGVKIHYAVKSNPDSRIIKTLAGLGSYFDVASDGEMLALTSLGVPADRLLYANTCKTAGGMKAARAFGVSKFTFDSKTEIFKMAEALLGGMVLLRIKLENKDSHIDLNVKFGANASEAMELLKLAREQGLDVAGLCFNVGSQCTNPKSYINGLETCRKIFDEAKTEGFNFKILDIGGGFPMPVTGEHIDIDDLTAQISEGLAKYFPDTEVWAEPGRFISGTTANLITRVIGAQIRNGQQWYFLDEGLYGTFSGIIFDHWNFDLLTFKTGEAISAVFAGPSCDSLDILFRDKQTEPLEVGNLILVPACGAYTSASATVFNGFSKAPIIYWEDVKSELCE